MPIYEAIILGIIQGITEFLPISSSAHLVLIPRLFGWAEHSIYFDAALHAGTLLAAIIFFRKDLIALIKNQELLFKILLATIPAGLAAILFMDQIETTFKSDGVIAFMMVAVGILMLVADLYTRKVKEYREYNKLSYKQVILIGIAQAFALIRGTSRSGITISTGLFLKLNREQAAKFAFILSIPIMLAATVESIAGLSNTGGLFRLDVLFGFLSSLIVGFLAIKFLLTFLKTHSLIPFVIYRFVVAGLIVISMII